MICIKNLIKKYGKDVIFDNTSFMFPDKGLICVLGASGSGKSTLLNLIAGFDSDYEGEVTVHGVTVGKMNADELCAYRRDNIGFVFQNYHLLPGYTAIDNILLVSDLTDESREICEEKAKELLEKVGLSEKCNQKIETLSGGQKQRVAIVRALMNAPSIILADEPTGALDRKNSAEIMELLQSISKEKLVIFITHDKKCAEYADQIVTVEGGKLVSEKEASDVEGTAVLVKEASGKIPLFQRAVKNFKVHLLRYIAVAVAISIGVLCFSLSLSSGNIMKHSINDFEEKNTALHNGYIKVEDNGKELLTLLENNAQLKNVYLQYILSDVTLRIGEKSIVMEEKYPMAKAAEKISYGIMPRRGENEIALSPSLAAKFGKDIQSLIGKEAEVLYNGQIQKVTVCGIFNASYDDFFVSSDVEQNLYKDLSGEAYSISYDVIKFEDIVIVSDRLKSQDIKSENASAEVGAFLNTFDNIKSLFLTVSILIFVISIIISAILLVKQQNTRFRETGLLSALGYTRKSVHFILMDESLILCAVAAACNGLLSLVAILCAKILRLNIILTVSQVLLSMCLTTVMILVVSVLANHNLIRTEPAEALRR